jgi:hypothetical protein
MVSNGSEAQMNAAWAVLDIGFALNVGADGESRRRGRRVVVDEPGAEGDGEDRMAISPEK